MLLSIYKWVKKYIAYIAIVIAVVVLVFVGVQQYKNMKNEKPKIITNHVVRYAPPNELAKTVNVSEKEAEKIRTEIIKREQPDVTFEIRSKSLDSATKDVTKAIKERNEALPKAAIEKTDRTIVTSNEEPHKVDVYKINLNKVHKIKVGATVIDDKLYTSVGYQAGKIEGIVHVDNEKLKVKGGTVLYTVKEW